MSTRSEGSMGATVPARRRDRNHGKVSVVDISAARKLGCRPATVHDRIHRRGVHIELAMIIGAAVELGNLELADRLYLPIHAARMAIPVEPFSRDLVLECQRIDLEEDAAEAYYHADPSPQNRAVWLRQLDRQAAAHVRLRRSIQSEMQA